MPLFLSRWGTSLLVMGLAMATYCAGGGSSLPDPCACTPTATDLEDHRHVEKHIPLPTVTPQPITVSTILSWPVDSSLLSPDAPRAGRELQLFSIANAFVQHVRIVGSDCDVHVEISATPDKNAPRVIVETPVDSEYCGARRTIQQQLAAHGVALNKDGAEVTPAIPALIVGMAFEDFGHTRGTPQVATLWELHPAVVTLSQ